MLFASKGEINLDMHTSEGKGKSRIFGKEQIEGKQAQMR